MKRIGLIALLSILALSLSSCDKNNNADTNNAGVTESIEKTTGSTDASRFSAPFGLTWGMSLDDFKNLNSGDYKVSDNFDDCPFTNVTTKTPPRVLINHGEYELKFLPKHNNIKFDGLVSVEYQFSSSREENYQESLEKIKDNLDLKYGKPSEVDKKDNTTSYFYGADDGTEDGNVWLFVTEEPKDYRMWLNYTFYPKEYQEDIIREIDNIKLECKKKRNPL